MDLPHELVDHVLSYLQSAADIAAARLVNHTFYNAATNLLLAAKQTPSELFTLPTADEAEEVESAKPFGHTYRHPQHPFTTWTWLRIPPSVPLEDQWTTIGRRFIRLVVAPSPFKYRVNEDGDLNHELRVHGVCPPESGRKGTCWGRVQEDPGSFCIVIQWYSRLHWNAFRLSEHGLALRNFLESVAPGCGARSSSEDIPLPPQLKHRAPLFASRCEVRRAYFSADITAKQKSDLEVTDHVRNFTRWRPLQPKKWPGWSLGCWLRGLTRVDVKLMATALMVFPSDSEYYMYRRLDVETGHEATDQSTAVFTKAELLEEELRRAGMLSDEVLHCDFRSGPWRN